MKSLWYAVCYLSLSSYNLPRKHLRNQAGRSPPHTFALIWSLPPSMKSFHLQLLIPILVRAAAGRFPTLTSDLRRQIKTHKNKQINLTSVIEGNNVFPEFFHLLIPYGQNTHQKPNSNNLGWALRPALLLGLQGWYWQVQDPPPRHGAQICWTGPHPRRPRQSVILSLPPRKRFCVKVRDSDIVTGLSSTLP